MTTHTAQLEDILFSVTKHFALTDCLGCSHWWGLWGTCKQSQKKKKSTLAIPTSRQGHVVINCQWVNACSGPEHYFSFTGLHSSHIHYTYNALFSFVVFFLLWKIMTDTFTKLVVNYRIYVYNFWMAQNHHLLVLPVLAPLGSYLHNEAKTSWRSSESSAKSWTAKRFSSTGLLAMPSNSTVSVKPIPMA